MQTISSALERELKVLIAQRRKDLTETLTNGIAITSMEKYREHIGRLSELDQFNELIEEANKIIQER